MHAAPSSSIIAGARASSGVSIYGGPSAQRAN